MLIAATAIFIYYTVWTLFMVRNPKSPSVPPYAQATQPIVPNALLAMLLVSSLQIELPSTLLTPNSALRRRRPHPPLPLPPPRLGHPYSGDPPHPRHHRRRQFPLRGHDTE